MLTKLQAEYLALDFDGVFYQQTEEHLAEWRRASLMAAVHLAGHRQLSEDERTELLALARQGYQQHGSSLHFLTAHFNLAVDDTNVRNQLFARVHDEFKTEDLIPPDPELTTLLQNFGPDRIAVVTNGSDNHVIRGLDRVVGVNCRKAFKAVIAQDKHGYQSKKDSAALWQIAAKELGAVPHDVLLVEDNPAFVEPAIEAGFTKRAFIIADENKRVALQARHIHTATPVYPDLKTFMRAINP